MSDGKTEALGARALAELELLSAIERGEVVSQMSLTRRVGVSVGMINALVKRAIGKGYAKMRQAPYKRYAYYLTPQGFAEKSRLVAEYLETSLEFFRAARAEYERLFDVAAARGQKTILLVGEGELLEIAMIAALSRGVRVAGVLDLAGAADGPAPFELPRRADAAGADLVVLTDRRAPQESFEKAKRLAQASGAEIVAPGFLKVVPDRAALMARFDETEGRDVT